MENFVLYNEIGKVNEQTIYKARRKGTIKYLAISCADRNRRPLISNHVRFVHILKHPNVLTFHEWYETSNHLWLVMELCTGGSLEQVIKEESHLPENLVRKFGSDIVRGLEYIHARGVLFNDLKPSRFLLDGSGNTKLFDFSVSHLDGESLDEVLARFSEDEEIDGEAVNCDVQAITAYTAPEVLQLGAVSTASDFWGLGCLLHEMFFGRPPFGGDTQEELSENILHRGYTLPNTPGCKASASLGNLLNALLVKEPLKRMTLATLLKHEFWQNSFSDIEGPYSKYGVSTGKDTNTSCLDTNTVDSRDYEDNINGNMDDSLDEFAPSQANFHSNTKDLDFAISRHISAAQETLAVRTSLLNTSMGQDALRTETVNFTLHATSPLTATRKQQPLIPAFETPVKLREKSSPAGQTNPSLRMTKSEYIMLDNEDDSHDPPESMSRSRLQLTSEERQVGALGDALASRGSTEHRLTTGLAPPEMRANLALVYPWGDDSPHLPQEAKVMISMWTQIGGVVDTKTPQLKDRTPMVRRRCRLASRVSSATSATLCVWRPKQLNDYYRWSRVTLPARVEGLSSVLNAEKLRGLSPEKVEAYLIEVLRVFRFQYGEQTDNASSTTPRSSSRQSISRQQTRIASPSLLVYIIWLFSTTTAQLSRAPMVAGTHGLSRQIILVDLFVEASRQLKAASSATVDTRVSLCRLCCLAAHRIACCLTMQHQCPTPIALGKSATQTWWHAVCFSLPSCLTTLIELLREPTYRIGLRLCQVALLTLGELLLCATCILQANIRESLSNPAANVDSTSAPPQLDVPASQWQTVVFYLLRYLSLNSSSGGNNSGATLGSTSVSSQGDKLVSFDQQHSRSGGIGVTGIRAGADGTIRLTDTHVRLAAARTIDTFVIAMIANELHDLHSTCPPNTVIAAPLASASHAIGAISTADVVGRLWTELTLSSDGLSTSTAALQGNSQLRQEVALTCASALAGLIRINPALFTTGLIDRVGAKAFITLLEPPAGGPACHLTNLVTRLMSATASGLLVPLSSSFTEKQTKHRPSIGRLQNSPSGGTGTPAACRRILGDHSFMLAVVRYLESPHAIVRCKAYLISAAIITNSPQDGIPIVFDARLPLCLERDLRSTEHISSSQLPNLSITTIAEDNEDTSPTTTASDAQGLVYLTATTHYFTELLVNYIVPLICNQVLCSLGSSATLDFSGKSVTRVSRVPSTGANSARRSSYHRSVSMVADSGGNLANVGTARAWLPAYQCLSTLISACPMVRSRVLLASVKGSQVSEGEEETDVQSNNEHKRSHFSLLSFLGQLLDIWVSGDPISSAAIVASVHQPGSVESQLLFTTLIIAEEFSQQAELVEAYRRDFICLVLPGLARLAVATGARPETRAICAKIINNLAEQLRSERCSISSMSNLYDSDYYSMGRAGTPVSSRPLSADVEMLIKELGDQRMCGKSQSFSDIPTAAVGNDGSDRKMVKSLYEPKTSTERRSLVPSQRTFCSGINTGGGVGHNSLGVAVRPPSPDAMAQLFEVVNQLMIPYADCLISCPEAPTAQTAFIHLLHLLLTSVPSQESLLTTNSSSFTPNQQTSPRTVNSNSTSAYFVTSARNLVSSISAHGLDVGLVRLLANELLSSSGGVCDNPPVSEADKLRLSLSKSHVTSTLCFTIFRLVPQLLRWPKDSRPSRMIIDLRLLELIAIAVLQLGECIQHLPTGRPITNSQLKMTGKKIVRSACQPAVCPPYKKRPASSSASTPHRKPEVRVQPKIAKISTNVADYYAPLLVALEAMNALLDHVAHVVRVALAARSANFPESETVALAAEEILSASRPPPGLAGLLVRLVGRWQPSNRGEGPASAAHAVLLDENCGNIDHKLSDYALRSLTNFASLYGGEYSRSALTQPASSSLSMTLLYLIEEEENFSCNGSNRPPPTTSAVISWQKPPRQPKPNDDFVIKRYKAAYRRRLRLLLRIIRRLVSSDPVCRGYLVQQVSMKKEKDNLFATLECLSTRAERNADAPTLKLLHEIIDNVVPSSKFKRNNEAVSLKRASKVCTTNSNSVIQPRAISTTM